MTTNSQTISPNPKKMHARKLAGLQTDYRSPYIDPAMRHQMIATAAYYRAEQRSFNGSTPEADWYAAEIEIDRLLQGDTENGKTIEHLETLLADWDVQFEKLKDRVAKAKTRTRAEYEKQLLAIADKRIAINEKIKDLRQHTGEVWDELKHSIENTWGEIRRETEHVASRFTHEATPTEGGKKGGKQ